jgi:hypothetical protein
MQQRGGISVWLLVVGLLIGIGAGLYYAWQVDPRVVTDVSPAQLSRDGKRNYVIAITVAWARDSRVEVAAERLAVLGLNWQDVADFACELAREGKISTNAGLLTIRSMVQLAASQGTRGCASDFVDVKTSTPTVTPTFVTTTPTSPPPPTKTPTPTLGATYTPPAPDVSPTATPEGEFVVNVRPFCDAAGTIEVTVQQSDGSGLPGIAVRVEQADGQGREVFFTGLKPEKDLGYADFVMTTGNRYIVSLRDFREARTTPLIAGPCSAESQQRAAYRVTFRRTIAR